MTFPKNTAACAILINTPLQRGARAWMGEWNRFSGFHDASLHPSGWKPLKRLSQFPQIALTPLKQGVNENRVRVPTLDVIWHRS